MVPLHTPESAPGSPGSPLYGDSSKPSRVVVLCCDDLDQRWLVQRLALLGQLHLHSFQVGIELLLQEACELVEGRAAWLPQWEKGTIFLQYPGYRFEPWQRLVGAAGGQG